MARPADVVWFPVQSQRTLTREAVTLAEVPGFLRAVREAMEARPDIPRAEFVCLGRKWHPSFHPTASRVDARELIEAVTRARATA